MLAEVRQRVKGRGSAAEPLVLTRLTVKSCLTLSLWGFACSGGVLSKRPQKCWQLSFLVLGAPGPGFTARSQRDLPSPLPVAWWFSRVSQPVLCWEQLGSHDIVGAGGAGLGRDPRATL